MPYVPNLPNAYDKSLIPVSIRNSFFEETLLTNTFSGFMGTSSNDMIQVRDESGSLGPTSTFTLSREIDYKKFVTDYDQISGKGQQLKFYEDHVTVNLQAASDVLKGIQLTRTMTPIDIYNQLKPKLMTSHKRNLVYSLLNAATFGSYDPAGNVLPILNRCAVAGPNGSLMPLQATLNQTVAAQNTDATAAGNGLSVAHIEAIRDLAIRGGSSFEQEKRITPVELSTRDGFPAPTYVYLMDTPSYKSLRADPAWNQYFYRGMIENSYQPSRLSGSFVRGKINDVLIYEVPELGNFQITSGAVTSSWNLFCGAQAFGLVWREKPWFNEERTNHGTVSEMALLEIRGQKSLKFPSYQNEANLAENGIIHSIVRTA